MKYSHKLSDAIHVLTYIGISNSSTDLSSRAIASSIDSNPSLVRRLMATLSNAGLINSTPGKISLELSRPAKDISLLDVYNAIEEPELLHVDPKTNLKCIVGANIQATLSHAYDKVQQKAEQEMNNINIQEIVDGILAENKK
ncbi:Rrf2 family transcriptional regulator [Apilactobacillus micheneri]|uniref:Rrf2 family transcriptional regulator n=1 Tax=Apilactobacillus micheneri TaxID=1899430 RepID=UPI000D524ADE|nr:Rrf2 family transcriptional regulator [Apilactobacillus micheneri]GAY80363.1 putative HTH-type transcriptional regulator YwnA [Apilactobacillus micheneri]